MTATHPLTMAEDRRPLTGWYMDRPEEIAKHTRLCAAKGEPDAGRGSRALFEVMAAGNLDLFDALWTFWNFEHALDDLLDESTLDGHRKEIVLFALVQSVSLALVFRPDAGEKLNLPLGEFTFEWERLLAGCGWPADRQDLARAASAAFFAGLQTNPLIRRQAGELRALFISAIFRCLDGDAMAASADPKRRALAPAVRCGDVDVIIYLIFLARGFGAARVWGDLREYDDVDE